MNSLPNLNAEWLEADGLGGFASGAVGGWRDRRYHALLLAATTPPAGRMAFVNGFDAEVHTASGRFAISSQRYAPGVLHPDGASRLKHFAALPWPRWTYELPCGLEVVQEIFVPHGHPACVIRWTATGAPATLTVRPYFSGRDFHSLHHENPAFAFPAAISGNLFTWHPYPGVPGVTAKSNGEFTPGADWYRQFSYAEELARGLDGIEDLAAPGVFHFDLSRRPGELLFTIEGNDEILAAEISDLARREQTRRSQFSSPILQAADSYFVRRGSGRTLIAGYPWFGDWGRDTFISLRGLCLAAGREAEARDILLEWSGAVSEGMLPNRFPDRGETPEYNSVDASLWFVIAVHELLTDAPKICTADQAEVLNQAVQSILSGYFQGTRYGIRCDADGLLACGESGVQLTWMDAKVGGWVVTPRIGKPVEIQALWLNALRIGSANDDRWREIHDRGLESFREKFWNPERSCLFDVVDCDHQQGQTDSSLRPNQIFAIGGLPLCLLDHSRAQSVVRAVEEALLTPVGLRSLGPGEPAYHPRYEGGVVERDGGYHQGTVWPWLTGAFAEAWLRVRDFDPQAMVEARERFLAPLHNHLAEAGLGHISEIADAEAPHTPRGCPFQAWSLGELLRVETLLRKMSV